MSSDLPPEWDDGEDPFWADDQLDAETEARLSAVAAYLAAAPAPALPDAYAARISAAIAAEAADRASSPAAGSSPPADTAPAGGHSLTGRDRHRGRARLRRGLRSRPMLLTGSALAFVVLIGFGFLLSHGASSSSSATANSAVGVASSSASRPAFGANEAGPAAPRPSSTAGAAFSVTESGTAYRKVTLAAQVRANLTVNKPSADALPVPTATGSALSGVGSGTQAVTAGTPSTQLRGCVLKLTGGAAPGLVDEATYQGEKAYVIATSSHVWVVGLGCSASNPELIASAALAG